MDSRRQHTPGVSAARGSAARHCQKVPGRAQGSGAGGLDAPRLSPVRRQPKLAFRYTLRGERNSGAGGGVGAKFERPCRRTAVQEIKPSEEAHMSETVSHSVDLMETPAI